MRTWLLLPSFILLANLCCGCSHPVANPMARNGRVLSTVAPVPPVLPKGPGSPIFTPESANVLTLNQAIGLALMHNPELQSYSWEARAAEARRLQADLRPNPEVALDVENFGGSGAASGWDVAETTVQLGQLIELADKRTKRRQLAARETDLARWDYESKRWDVYADVTRAFVVVLAAQESLALQEELLTVSEQVLETAAARVEAGKDPLLEQTRAEVALSRARIARRQAAARLASARQQLTALWGQSQAEFERAVGAFEKVSPPPSEAEVTAMLPQNPEIARWSDEVKARRAALVLERARAVPDPTVFAGVRYLADEGDEAFVLSVGLPVPLFDRNQGGIQEAGYELAKARAHSKAVHVSTQALLVEGYQSLAAAYDEVTALRSQVLPGARTAFEIAREGYREGKFDYLAVLDAQRTLFDTQMQYIEALESYHTARVDLDRLTVGPGQFREMPADQASPREATE